MSDTKTEGVETAQWSPAHTGMLAALSVGWLAVALWLAYVAIVGDPTRSSLAAYEAALAFPDVIAAALLAGAAAGLLALGRFGDPDRLVRRLAFGAAAGLLVGLLAAAAVIIAYGTAGFLPTMAIGIGLSALAGGAAAAARPAVAVAAGLAGALACVALGMVKGRFDTDLIRLFGGTGENPAAYVSAAGWVQLLFSLLSGVLAALVPYAYLRRSGLTLPWPAYLLAGAVPGLLLFVAELPARLFGGSLVRAAGAASELDRRALDVASGERLTHALIVFFVGTVVAVVAVGRTLRSSTT
jgi:hypothetical protein